MSLSGNFAEDKGIKVVFCAVFLLFLVRIRPLVLEPFGPLLKSIFYDLPLAMSVRLVWDGPVVLKKVKDRSCFAPHRDPSF